jgi:hypothetical protein
VLFKEFFTKYKNYFIAALVLLLFLFAILFLLSDNSPIRNAEKQAKKELKELHKENEILLKELTLNRDSIQLLHKLAIENNNRDTIYINQIKWLKNRTNEEISHFNNLSLDSQYAVFTREAELFINSK